MRNRTLVAYASRYGSTREIAEQVAAVLRAAGLDTDCRPMNDIRTVDEYRAFVLGAPFYYGRWPRPARRFLSRFGHVLAHRDVAVFATGQVDPQQPVEEIREQLDAMLAHYDWLRPFLLGMFGGRWDPAGLSWPMRMLRKLPASPLRVLPATDLRNWEDIKTWADRVAADLKAHVAQPNQSGAAADHGSRSGAPWSLIQAYVEDQQREPRKSR
ncbi:flavodoxin domain-containing protein [Nocardia huaxiensis]|uniref:Flavodoxin domain-containing protein n=1 Tax=Nocardia huaxiensis TaxID=2755382 RepID=A0A7D6ZLI6_9NOCA|nr:flavodoxin domain-containing protein [Nocardia huaxiensis]QLY28545.1 flavodoxin domain-containing protein [Nocardia huaxiensis]UFS97988.1 flavodoxin domain-containing protein [Nocardia huaxiensis]